MDTAVIHQYMNMIYQALCIRRLKRGECINEDEDGEICRKEMMNIFEKVRNKTADELKDSQYELSRDDKINMLLGVCQRALAIASENPATSGGHYGSSTN